MMHGRDAEARPAVARFDCHFSCSLTLHGAQPTTDNLADALLHTVVWATACFLKWFAVGVLTIMFGGTALWRALE